MIQNGEMQVGELTGFLSYVMQILNSLMMISNVFLMMTRSMASGSRILEIIDEKIDITDQDAKDLEVKKGSIEFDHVSFKYKKDAEEEVLTDITLNIPAGSTFGIVARPRQHLCS